MAALVVGKSVLVANAMPFLRRFDTAPMIQPVLFKTIVYWATVFLVRFLEKLVEYLFAGGTLSEIPEYVATHFTWHRFAAIQIWIFVLFLIYTSFEELNARLGDGELMKIFFTRHSPVMKPPLRQRIRADLRRGCEPRRIRQIGLNHIAPKTSVKDRQIRGSLENCRFPFWPWHFLDRTGCPAGFSNPHMPKHFRVRPLWKIARLVIRRLACDKAYPRLRSSYSTRKCCDRLRSVRAY